MARVDASPVSVSGGSGISLAREDGHTVISLSGEQDVSTVAQLSETLARAILTGAERRG